MTTADIIRADAGDQAFRLACLYCDRGSDVSSAADAALDGWTNIEKDDSKWPGEDLCKFWTHLGLCPVCEAEGQHE